MNAKRQLSGLKRVKWEKKSTKEKVKYLVKKLQTLDYKIPSYLKNGQLNDRQLKSQINKIERGLKALIKKENSNSKPKRQLSIDNRLNNYINRYNKRIDSTVNALKNMGLTEKQIDYLTGKDIFFPSRRNKSFRADGLTLKKIGMLVISDDERKLAMLNKLKNDYKKISFQAVYDRINDDTIQNQWFANFMSLDFIQNMKDYERQAIWKQWHTLSPLQKELFIKGELNNLRDKYLDIGTDELDKASENSYARIDRTINEYRQLDSFN
ncbi:MAG: hypothetical protein SOV57_04830 [Bacilli bacterium]|nr:hypothetical protein [Bacilli bacterium]